MTPNEVRAFLTNERPMYDGETFTREDAEASGMRRPQAAIDADNTQLAIDITQLFTVEGRMPQNVRAQTLGWRVIK